MSGESVSAGASTCSFPLWRAKAADLDANLAAPQAQVYRIAAATLEECLNVQARGTVTLAEASAIGGFSRDHLGRLIRVGQLENVGRKGSPRLRRADVPRKPGHLPPVPSALEVATARRHAAVAVAAAALGSADAAV